MIYGLDLFSGYGGITLALSEWVKPLAYCEIDRYAQGILLSRMSEGLLPYAPIWNDIKNFPSKDFSGKIDIIYGGFPCQDISVAGTGKGLAGKRSGLFYEVCRVVKEVQPTFVFLENVPAIRTRGLREVVSKLTNLRYDCRWTCVSAQEIGAPHLRKRWFLLANSNCKRTEWDKSDNRFGPWVVKNSEIDRNGIATNDTKSCVQSTLQDKKTWEIEPRICRMVNGCPNRVDRIKALGNGVVPAQAKKAFKKLIGLD